MKKLISIVLSLCMLFSCVAYAQSGITAHIKVDTQGENVVDYTVSVAEDEDGCIQITANGTADGETQDIFLQIGKTALVLGSQGENVQINYEDLIAALQNALSQTLTEEQMMVLSILYYCFTGLEGDLQIVGSLAEDELTRLVNVGMQLGVISYSREGIVFEADQDQLLSLVKAYAASLAGDSKVFETLSTTQLWSLLGLSENGVNEQAAFAEAIKSLDEVEMPDTFTLYIKAVIANTGSITLDVDFALTDGSANLALDAAFDGSTLEMSVNGFADDATIEAKCTAVFGDNTIEIAESYAVKSEKEDIDVTGSYTAGISEGKIDIESTMNGTESGATVDANVTFHADCEEKEIVGKATINAEAQGQSVSVNAECSLDEVNGLYGAIEVQMPDGQKNGIYVKGNAQQTEYGYEADLTCDMIVNGQPVDGVFALNIVLSDVVKIHAHAMKLDGKDAFQTNLFDFDLTLNTENAKLDAALTYEGHTLSLDGTLSEDAYTLTAKADDEVLATAVQELLPGRSIEESLILGKLTIDLYDGTHITRTTNMTQDTISWLFVVTDKNGETEELEIGLRNLTQGDRFHYEIFATYGGSTVTVGLVFEDMGEEAFMELYVDNAQGQQTVRMLDAQLELSIIEEAPAHAEGMVIPQSAIEQLLVPLLKELSEEINDAF